MSNYKRHYPAHQAARALMAELWDELPLKEQNELSTIFLETFLAGSDNYRAEKRLTGYHLMAYIRLRAADYYALHFYQRHHEGWQGLRLRSRLEVALINSMGNNIDTAFLIGVWNTVRITASMYAARHTN